MSEGEEYTELSRAKCKKAKARDLYKLMYSEEILRPAEPNVEQLKNDIEQIKQRNARVEADKAWETSLFRKILVAILTYIVVVLFFTVAKLPKPLVNATVLTAGFLLSTLSIPFFKKLRLRQRQRVK